MVSASDFVSGARIKWRRLGVALFGAGILAYFEGVVAVLLSLADVPLSLLGGLANFSGRFIGLVAGFPAALARGGWAGATQYVLEAGIAGYVFAIVIVLATTGTVAVVVSRV
ncbi:hypothetical protein [Halomicrobium salinisoli]|uniref:hypothetical protein n=1 Tax=Halomicrobium salinisoli TaxID=2878391 RepID=UPI001CF0C68B|nr:hypothetical protein [Halomicrobium salinisoli]